MEKLHSVTYHCLLMQRKSFNMNLKILAAKRWNHYQDSKTKGRIFDIEPGGGSTLKKTKKNPNLKWESLVTPQFHSRILSLIIRRRSSIDISPDISPDIWGGGGGVYYTELHHTQKKAKV